MLTRCFGVRRGWTAACLSALGLASWFLGSAALAADGVSSPGKVVPAAASTPPSLAAFFAGATTAKAHKIHADKKTPTCACFIQNNTLEIWLPGGVLIRTQPVSIDRASHTLITRATVIDTHSLLSQPESWQVLGGGQMDFVVAADGNIDAVSQITWEMIENSPAKRQRTPVRWKIVLE